MISRSNKVVMSFSIIVLTAPPSDKFRSKGIYIQNYIKHKIPVNYKVVYQQLFSEKRHLVHTNEKNSNKKSIPFLGKHSFVCNFYVMKQVRNDIISSLLNKPQITIH